MGLTEAQSGTEPADKQVVARVLQGEPALFEVLVERYEKPLFRLALSRLGRPSLAEEAVQEAFLAAFKSLRTFNPEYAFRTWLWTILLNQCRALGKRQQRHQQHQELSFETLPRLEGAAPLPHEEMVQAEQGEQLQHWIAKLPEAEADAIRLRYFGELKFREIAKVQQCGLATAKKRVRRGLDTLGQWLSERVDH